VTTHPALWDKGRKPFKLSVPDSSYEERLLRVTLFTNSIARVPRTIFFTRNGQFGSIVGKVKEGDRVAVLSGGNAVYILRPFGADFKFVESGFVLGLMHGLARPDPAFGQIVRHIRIY
jgi:hypothetical protein